MRIVCGTDFSSPATAAVNAAAQLALRMGARLELVCATGARLTAEGLPETEQGLGGATTRAAELAAEVERVRALGVTADGSFDMSVPDFALCKRARGDDVPLIVLGAVGHSLVERVLIGSVAERVAMEATKPVLVIRRDASWNAWGAGQRALRVLVAFDAGASATTTLRWAAWLAGLGQVQLTVCWVVHPAVENHKAGAMAEGAGTELLPPTRESLWRDFQRHVADVTPLPSLALHLEPSLGRVDSALTELAAAGAYDLLVVGSHQRRGFQRLWEASVSRGVLHRAPMDVAVVPHLGAGA